MTEEANPILRYVLFALLVFISCTQGKQSPVVVHNATPKQVLPNFSKESRFYLDSIWKTGRFKIDTQKLKISMVDFCNHVNVSFHAVDSTIIAENKYLWCGYSKSRAYGYLGVPLETWRDMQKNTGIRLSYYDFMDNDTPYSQWTYLTLVFLEKRRQAGIPPGKFLYFLDFALLNFSQHAFKDRDGVIFKKDDGTSAYVNNRAFDTDNDEEIDKWEIREWYDVQFKKVSTVYIPEMRALRGRYIALNGHVPSADVYQKWTGVDKEY